MGITTPIASDHSQDGRIPGGTGFQDGQFPGDPGSQASRGACAGGESPWDVSSDLAASAKADLNVRIGIARPQEREILLLVNGAYDDGEQKPHPHAYAASGESDRHQDIIRMTEALCQRICYKTDAEIEIGARRAIRDDLQMAAREKPPGIQRVAALLRALMPHYKRLCCGIEP